MKILLVEDDEYTAQLIFDALTAHHYLVNTARDGKTGLELTKTYRYDLVLLDVVVPGLDSMSLCRQLRSQGAQMPILMLAGKSSSSSDRIEGLEAGADDYVMKPFDVPELVARIRALLRRRQATLQSVIAWGKLQIDLNTCEVRYHKTPVHLTPKEYGLLELFLRNPRRIFDRNSLLDSIWKVNEYPGERAVTTQIKGLRQKLKSAGMTVDWLETIYGLGYRLRPEPSECSILDEPHAVTIQAQAEVEAAIQTVWQKLKETLTETFVSFDQICTQAIATDLAIVNPNLDPALRQQVILEAHRLAGSLGSFGVGGSDLARQIEQLLRANTSLTPPEALQLSAWVEALKQVIIQPRHHQSPSTLTSNLQPNPLSPSPVHLPGPFYHLLLVDDDTEIAQHIQAVAQSNGFEVVVATSLIQARYRVAQRQFDLILLDLTFPETAENGLTFLDELTHQVPNIPVLVMTGCDRLIDRVKVAHLGGRAFIQKPIAPAKLLETVARILAKKDIVGHRVLVVDDDPFLLQTLSALLEPWGIQVTTLNDSQQFWKTLENTDPHLLILDIEMPHFNGIELCQTVRNDPYWGELPILFLSAHRDADIVQRVFMAGADDYVNKPIMAPELLARVLNRLQRRPIQLPSLTAQF